MSQVERTASTGSATGSMTRQQAYPCPFTILAFLLGLMLVLSASAGAASRVSLGIFGNAAGVGGGAVKTGKGLAVNRTGAGGVAAGDVYVGDASNQRVQEFSAAGDFVRAWGAGVVPGAAAGTANLTSVSGSGDLTAGSNQVAAVSGIFTAGQTLSGAGIPPETTITAVGAGTLTLSQAATASGSGEALTAGEVTSVVTTSQTFVVGQVVAGSGIPAGTRIVKVESSLTMANSKLVLSNAVTASASNVPLTVAEGAGNVPANDRQTITVPAAATGSYKLKFKTTLPTVERETAAAISVAASPAEVESALAGLSNVGAGNLVVTETASRIYSVEFKGKFADSNVEQLTVSAQPASGTVTIATSQQGAQAFEICTTECVAGAASAAAGGMSALSPAALSVDQATGNVYVVDSSNLRVDVFSANGEFEGAFGWKVNASAPAEELQFCTAVTGCQAGVSKEAAGGFGNFGNGFGSSAVDPTTGHLYVSDPGNVRLDEFQFTRNGASEVTGVSFVRAIGWSVNATTPEAKVQVCTTLTGCKKGLGGNGEGQFSVPIAGVNPSPGAIAVDSQGNVYAVSLANGNATQECTVTAPCRILKFNASGAFVETFGPAAGESAGDQCQLTYTAGVESSIVALDIAVDPSDDHVYVLKESGSSTYRVYEFDSEGGKGKSEAEKCDLSPPANLPALTAGPVVSTHGLAVGTEGRIYTQNTAVGVAGRIYTLGPAPPPSAEMTVAEGTGASSARLAGKVTPPEEIEGQGFATSWHFEYSTTNSPNPANWTKTPVPDGSAGSQHIPQTVEAEINGLSANTHYFARVCATTLPTVCSAPLEFSTNAVAPSVALTYPEAVTQTEATLGAHIKPNNRPTSYHFEWATPQEWAAAPGVYGHRLPDRDRQIGSGPGGEIVNVEEPLSGLRAASVYHFRVVATNASGTTLGPDQEVETLNSCGLLDNRCFELVTPADKGPVALPLKSIEGNGFDNHLQPAPQGGAFAYSVALGYPDATVGGEVVYLSKRESGGWSSAQISPPASPSPEQGTTPTRTKALASSLDCGIVSSAALLTPDAPLQVVQAGGNNMFRRDNSTGAYRVVTNLPPLNPDGVSEGKKSESGTPQEYEVIGVSGDCGRILFRTGYHYPGLPGTGRFRTYEWNDGALSAVGQIPGPGGPSAPVAASVLPGGGAELTNVGEDISADSRYNAWGAFPNVPGHVFFTAVSQFGGDAGNPAVFLRQGPSGSAIDISQSRTAIADRGARLQIATTDGTRAFFLANYGLVAAPEKGGTTTNCVAEATVVALASGECDLYEWRAEGTSGCAEAIGCLTDLTADHGHPANTAGAAVKGVLGISADGSYVYFAAQGQLLPGKGPTFAANVAANTFGVYVLHEGQLGYVGTVGRLEASHEGGLLVYGEASPASIKSSGGSQTSQVTPDGKHLLFESSADVTGYASGGSREAYLYSADSGESVCVSCRRDRSASLDPPFFPPIPRLLSPMAPVRSLTSNGQRVLFASLDRLATGAVAGQLNLYEWKRGQISMIATELSDLGELKMPNEPRFRSLGISEDGNDFYFTSPASLVSEDFDGRGDIYDARAGGGFPPKPLPPAPCSSLTEGGCQGQGTPASPSSPTPSSSTFSGPGNEPSQRRPKHKKKAKQHKKAKQKKHKKRKSKQKARSAQGAARGAAADRGVAK